MSAVRARHDPPNIMNILLTGHKGFIGSHMLAALAGHNVSTFEWGDPLPVLLNTDWVIHMGAISSTTEKNIDRVFTQNYDFSVWLYEECKKRGVGFQFASSASVYGITDCFQEGVELDPRSAYSWSKCLFERYMLRNPSKYLTQVFRYFNVYGPEGEAHKGDQASPQYKFTRQAQETGVIQIFEGSENYSRDFIHVGEIVKTHLDFFHIKQSDIWNLGTGKTKTFQSVAEEISVKYNAKIETIPMPDELKMSYQKYTCADMTKMNMVRWQSGPMQESAKL